MCVCAHVCVRMCVRVCSCVRAYVYMRACICACVFAGLDRAGQSNFYEGVDGISHIKELIVRANSPCRNCCSLLVVRFAQVVVVVVEGGQGHFTHIDLQLARK